VFCGGGKAVLQRSIAEQLIERGAHFRMLSIDPDGHQDD
jgi:hypothetical protein